MSVVLSSASPLVGYEEVYNPDTNTDAAELSNRSHRTLLYVPPFLFVPLDAMVSLRFVRSSASSSKDERAACLALVSSLMKGKERKGRKGRKGREFKYLRENKPQQKI